MAGNVKGITIEFRGETTKLSSAIRQIDKETRGLDKELRNINTALKFNPTSIDLWRQKQTVLGEKIKESQEKLKLLKNEQARMDASGVDKNSAEYRNLQREIITTESKLKTFKGQLKEVGNVKLRAVSEQFKQLGTNLTNAGQAMVPLSAAGAAVAGSLGILAVKSGQAADDLNTLSKVTGVSTQQLQLYKAGADLVDVSVETIAKSQQKLTKSMSSASGGTGKQAEAFKKLGVSVTNADGSLKSSDQVFNEVIKALGGVSNETERNALAMTLMGKSAMELNPLIEDGGKTYEQLAQTMAANNLKFVDQETLDGANRFNDALDTLKASGLATLQTLGTQLASYLAPAMETIAGALEKVLGWLSQLSPQTLTIIGVIASVIAVIAPLLLFLGKISFAISSITGLMSTLGLSFGAIAGPIGIAIAAIAAVIAIGVLLYKNWDKIKAAAKALFDKIKTTFESIKTTVINVWNTIKTAISNAWNAIKTTVSNGINAVKTKISSVFTAVLGKIVTIWNKIHFTINMTILKIKLAVKNTFDKVKSNITTVFNNVLTKVKTIWGKIKEAITKPIEKAKETVEKAIDKIKEVINGAKLKLPHFKLPHFKIDGGELPWGIGGKGRKPSISVDWYAKGGIFDSASLIGVGEKGPEAVVPLDTLWKKLDNIAEASSGPAVQIVVNAAPGMDVNALAAEVERRLINSTNRRRLAW